ncbi:MAG: epimerase, partial [bacterium]
PGHRWPVLLLPLYWLGSLVPMAREAARRLGLVTLAQMLHTLVWSIERPATALRVLEVPDIRRGALEDT